MKRDNELLRAMAEYIIASGREETQAARMRIRELLDAPLNRRSSFGPMKTAWTI